MRGVGGRGRVCRREEQLLPSTKMFISNTSFSVSWETVHVQVPLSCISSWDSERLLPLFRSLFPGPFHSTEGFLPEGLSKVRVRLCPCSNWMRRWISKLAFTVEGAGHLCHTHSIPKEKGRSQETKSASIPPVPTSFSRSAPSCPPPALGRASLFFFPTSILLLLLPFLVSPSFFWLLALLLPSL